MHSFFNIKKENIEMSPKMNMKNDDRNPTQKINESGRRKAISTIFHSISVSMFFIDIFTYMHDKKLIKV